jgi:hypothetical protein
MGKGEEAKRERPWLSALKGSKIGGTGISPVLCLVHRIIFVREDFKPPYHTKSPSNK